MCTMQRRNSESNASRSSFQFSDQLAEFVNYFNPKFEENSVTTPLRELSPSRNTTTMHPTTKLATTNMPLWNQPTPEEPVLKEMSLIDMGIKVNEVENWDRIEQAPKDSLYRLLRHMIENQIKTSVQICIGDVAFNCHMLVLQCYSDFFMECTDELVIKLPPERVTPHAFYTIYDWMLADQPKVGREGILELLNAAIFLGIQALINQCWSCLADAVFSEEIALILFLEAGCAELANVQQLMLPRISKFFLTLVSLKEFLNLTVDDACALMKSNMIAVNTEIEIFMSVVRWLNHDWGNRGCEMLNVTKCVRFGLMPPWFLVSLTKSPECKEIDRIVNDLDVQNLINEGISYTTYRLYYGENHEKFLEFLQRGEMNAPMLRQWVYDKHCSYHHGQNCCNMQNVTYGLFLEYLRKLHTLGNNHWKLLQNSEDTGLVKCCNNEECLRPREAAVNVFPMFVKPSRDQGVQVNAVENEDDNTNYWEYKDTRPKEVVNKIQKKTPHTRVTSTFINEDKHKNVQKNKQYKQQPQQVQPHPVQQQQQSKYDHPKGILRQPNNRKDKFTDDEEYHKMVLAAHARTTDHRNQYGNAIKTLTPTQKSHKKSEELHHNGENTDSTDEQPTAAAPGEAADPICSPLPRILIIGGIDPYRQKTVFPATPPSRYQQRQQMNSSGQSESADIDGDNYGDQVLMYQVNATEWQHYSYIPFGARHHHAAVVCNGVVYVIGGTRTSLGTTRKSNLENSIWSFDPNSRKWNFETRLPETRRDFAAIAIDDKHEWCQRTEAQKRARSGIFVIGGESGNGTALKSVWYFDVKRKHWTEKASLNVGRYGFSAAIINNQIWVAGGIIDESPQTTERPVSSSDDNSSESRKTTADMITDTMETFNLKCANNPANIVDGLRLCGTCDTESGGKWVRCETRLRIPRVFGKFCKISKKEVYLVGGIGLTGKRNLTSLTSIERYNFTERQWQTSSDIKWARHGHDVVALKERIIIMGGVSTIENRTLDEVESFCTKTGKSLQDVPKLPWPLSGSAAVILD